MTGYLGASLSIRSLLCLLVALVLSACTIGLVPAYDAELTEGLNESNKQAQILFASVETGSPKEEFGKYEATYATLIGSFSELRQRAAARPVPPLATRLQKTKLFTSFCNANDNPTACLNASPESLAVVLTTLRTMRDTHRSAGLPPAMVQLSYNQYQTAVQQALTVESALKR